MKNQIQFESSGGAWRKARSLFGLPDGAFAALSRVTTVESCRRGSVLFEEGQDSTRLYLIGSGRVRLFLRDNGSAATSRIALPGEVLGLSAVTARAPYQTTAQVLDDALVAVVSRKDWVQFLQEFPEACLRIVQLLSDDVGKVYGDVREVAFNRKRVAPLHTHSF